MIETSKEYVFGTEAELRASGFNPAADARNGMDAPRAKAMRYNEGFVDRDRLLEHDAKMEVGADREARSKNKNRATSPHGTKSRGRAAAKRARRARRVAR